MTSIEYSIYMKIKSVYPEKLSGDKRKLLTWLLENGFVAPLSTVDRKTREYRAKKAIEISENEK